MTTTFPPGDPHGIWDIADGLDSRAKVLTSAADQLAALRKIPWYSEAGDAYRTHVAKRCRIMDDNAADMTRAATVLRDFGKYLLDLQREYAELEQKRTMLAATLVAASPDTAPDPIAAVSMAQTVGAQANIQFRWQEAYEQATADIKALDLYLGDDAANPGLASTFKWLWDDHFPPNRDVDHDILAKGSFDQWSVKQGGISSCFLLSALMGFMRTDAGDTMIRNNIRWDAGKKGYWVTLYHNGQPKEYFVDQVFDQCALENDDKSFLWIQTQRPGIPALYEAAIYQATGKYFVDNGGQAHEAMELITGEPAEVHRNGRGESVADRLPDARQVLAGGGAVVVGTLKKGAFPGGGETVEVTVEKREEGQLVKHDVTLGAEHAYMVERIEDDGTVWVRNPHGAGNAMDGGGTMRLSQEDFNKYFRKIQYSDGGL